MIEKLLIVPANEIRKYKREHSVGNAVTALKLELESTGASDMCEMKHYSKTGDKETTSDIRSYYHTDNNATIFLLKADGISDINDLMVYLTLLDSKAVCKDVLTPQIKQDQKDMFLKIRYDFETKFMPITHYWAYQKLKDKSHLYISEDEWEYYIWLVENIRMSKIPSNWVEFSATSKTIVEDMHSVWSSNIPASIRDYWGMSKFIDNTITFYDTH